MRVWAVPSAASGAASFDETWSANAPPASTPVKASSATRRPNPLAPPNASRLPASAAECRQAAGERGGRIARRIAVGILRETGRQGRARARRRDDVCARRDAGCEIELEEGVRPSERRRDRERIIAEQRLGRAFGRDADLTVRGDDAELPLCGDQR